MQYLSTLLTAIVLLGASPGVAPAQADNAHSAENSLGDTVPLDALDLKSITAIVLEENPLLSSSPGIKFAHAQRSVRSTDIADIVYLPHTGTGDIKEAFQVGCWRQEPDTHWTCNPAEIRRYLKLESQDFEVRVTGPIDSSGALALIEASRDALRAYSPAASTIPRTAIMVRQYNGEYTVSWGSPEGYQEIETKGQLTEGGNPAHRRDWQITITEFQNR